MSDSGLISKVAAKLRPVSTDISKGKGKLCMSTVYLKELNRAFDECHPEDITTSFNLTNAKASLQTDLRFLLELVRGTASLKLTPDLIRDEDPTNISRFHNVTTLEIHKVDVKQVVGIQKLRPRLQQLTCRHNLDNVSDILDRCGGDLSRSFNWGDLKVVNFAHNHIQSIDRAFEITPLLQKLDLSHNSLQEFDLIDCLPLLKELNLSYNKLEKAPKFRGSICKRLHVLQLNNNFIEDLSGLANLYYLQQLNLAHNCLLDRSNLLSVSQMHSLYYLDLRGNPLNFHPFYRTLTCNYLHKDTAILNVILDNVPLSDTEKSLAGSLYSPGRQSQLLGSTASFPSDDSLSSRRKQPKVRTVLIQDNDETEPVERKVSEVTPSPKIVNSELKQKIDEARAKGISINQVLDKFYSPNNSLINGDSARQEADTPDSKIESDKVPEDDDAQSDITDSVVDKEEEEPEELASDDEDIMNGKTFVCGTTIDANDLFIIITPTHISERDSVTMKERERWSLDAVKSCHRGDASNEVFVKFDVPRSDRKARTYFIDDQKTFVEALLEGMTRNKIPEIRIEYRCMKCDCSFSLPRTRRDQKVTCVKCQSNHVIESL